MSLIVFVMAERPSVLCDVVVICGRESVERFAPSVRIYVVGATL